MILNQTQENPAILSNVGEIGEFRIRNSAKAFNILSSGLYANKIRAIIRELSCNAVDSHVAAGKSEVPFEVHLPTTFEPWFAVRDFGTGLNHEQVTNIYTTYFESTKTNSNAFIGALGLGSKSPFSYTDNFTVTAIQAGVKNIYSAFINEQGVPSVALMETINTDEANGVEVRFSVGERYDFDKFQQEARTVYTYFSLKPNVTGVNNFTIAELAYKERDIIPGVHQTNDQRRSRAVMGNIAYPIEVPNAETNLGELARLLNCGLEMHFAIGELDFQASREGLSYIPTTIASIRTKLEALNAQLATHVAERANAIDNSWERALYLAENQRDDLWGAAVNKYATDTNFAMVDPTNRYSFLRTMKVSEEDLRTKYNMVVRGFTTSTGYGVAKTRGLKAEHEYTGGVTKNTWQFIPRRNTVFVRNDTKTGAAERAKFHFTQDRKTERVVYVMDAFDKTRAVDFAGFLTELKNPPTVIDASSMEKKVVERSNMNKVGVMRLSVREDRYRSKVVWEDAGTSFNDTDTYYYLPLSNYTADSKMEPETLRSSMLKSGISDVVGATIYGVRKNKIEDVKSNPNWINLEVFLTQRLAKITDADMAKMSLSLVDGHEVFQYTRDIVGLLGVDSPARKLNEKMVGVAKDKNFDPASLERLLRTYAKPAKITDHLDSIQKECESVMDRYPLLRCLNGYRTNKAAVAQYVNLIDNNR